MTTNNDLTGILNLAYEIEGLLMLLINRGDEASPEMKNLLIAKAGKLLADLTTADVTSSVHAPRTVVTTEPTQPRTEIPEVKTPQVEMPPVDALRSEVPAVRPEVKEQKAAEEAIAANVLAEERGDADVTAQTVNDTLSADSQLTLDEKLARERAADISKAFTLNDRFRFRRELFRNSDEEFRETLEVIGSMASMEEAEDYFFNDLCWDPSSPEVKEFMSIVAKHF